MIPDYYKAKGLLCHKYIEAFDLSYNLGSAVKYLTRAGKKVYKKTAKESAIADLEKARTHIDFELDRLKSLI